MKSNHIKNDHSTIIIVITFVLKHSQKENKNPIVSFQVSGSIF